METLPETTLAEFIRYNNWANQQVFEACQKLSEEQLAATLRLSIMASSIERTSRRFSVQSSSHPRPWMAGATYPLTLTGSIMK